MVLSAWLQRYANAVHVKGVALDNCWDFIDGTVRKICRLKRDQRLVYNRKVHAHNFQSVAAPNGMIANFLGQFKEEGMIVHFWLCQGF